MGCLATHVGWNHPQTAHLTLDAGITWLYRVACLNPATSQVLREWDRRGVHDVELRTTSSPSSARPNNAARRNR